MTANEIKTGNIKTVYHPFRDEDRAPMAALRAAAAQADGHLGPDMRDQFDEMIAMTLAAPGVTYESSVVGGVSGWWCRPAGAMNDTAILYVHGGAYVVGSSQAYRHMAGQIAARANAAVFVVEYRLAPEHIFPAAVQDALAAYKGLAAQGSSRIAIVGDSAGGGLALVTLSLAVAEAKLGTVPYPRCAVAMSPWTDLSLSGASIKDRAKADPVLSGESLAASADMYLNGHDVRDPLASPLFGNLTGLPAVSIHVGEDEILLDDSRRYAERIADAGGEAGLNVWEGMTHVFPTSLGTFSASESALDDIGSFLKERLG